VSGMGQGHGDDNMSPCHHMELGAGDYRRDKDSIPMSQELSLISCIDLLTGRTARSIVRLHP
jgi:hypothetical protein